MPANARLLAMSDLREALGDNFPNRLDWGYRCDLAADDDEGDCEQRDDDQEDHEEGAHVQPPLQAQLAGVGQGVQAGLT